MDDTKIQAGCVVPEFPQEWVDALAELALHRYDQEYNATHLTAQDFRGEALETLTTLSEVGALRGPALVEFERWRVTFPDGPATKGLSRERAYELAAEHGCVVSTSLVQVLTDGTEVLAPWREAPADA